MKNPKKVALHIISGEYYGGAERVQDLLSLFLPKFGYKVIFASLKNGIFQSSRNNHDSLIRDFSGPAWNFTRRVSSLCHWAADCDVSIVHTHNPIAGWVGTTISQRIGVPLIHHLHSPTRYDTGKVLKDYIKSGIEDHIMQRSSAVIAVSEHVVEYARKRGIPDTKINLVLNGVGCCAYPKIKKSGVYTLGVIALFRERKGLDYVIQAMKLIKSNYPAVLRVIGDFVDKDYMRRMYALVHELDLGDRIEWLGATEDVPRELASLDLLVIPSLYGEGLPMILLEAMASGVPVVGSRIPGLESIIKSCDCGVLANPGSATSIADAVHWMIDNPERMERFSSNAMRFYHEKFTAEKMAESVANIYNAIF